MRRFEIGKVAWEDFETEDLSWLYVIGKRSSAGVVPVPQILVDRLTWWRQHYKVASSRWVFPGRRGSRSEHVAPYTISLWLSRVFEAAGLDGLTPHQLRHTALAEVNDATGDLRAAMQLARHRDPRVTAGYTRTTRQKMEEVRGILNYDID